MPGRLDFEHEVYMDDAEDKVKDMEFGLVMAYGGSDQPEEAPPVAPTTDDSSKVAASSRLDTFSSAAAPSLPTSQAPRPPPPPEQTPSTAGTPAGSSPTKMDVDEPDHEDEDEDDEDDFPSQPAAKKQPPPGSSGTPVPGTSHRGLSSGAGKKAASNKGVAAGGGGGAGTSKKTMHPPSSLPKHILMAQQRSRSASDSPTPEPETASVASTVSDPDVPLASSSSSKTLPPGVALPPTPTTASDPLALTPVPPKPLAPPAAPPMNLVTDAVDYPEDADDLELKLAVLRIYNERLDRRREVKNVIFSRALTEHKRIVALERKRPQKEKDLIQKHKVFAKLQTAEDYEVLIDGLVCEFPLSPPPSQRSVTRFSVSLNLSLPLFRDGESLQMSKRFAQGSPSCRRTGPRASLPSSTLSGTNPSSSSATRASRTSRSLVGAVGRVRARLWRGVRWSLLVGLGLLRVSGRVWDLRRVT